MLLSSNAILCDIDGTLALGVDRSPYDFTKCRHDLINKPVLSVLRKYIDTTAVILITAREWKYHELTQDWLFWHDVPYDNLIMRPDNNKTGDDLLKKHLYEVHVKGKYNILFVLDDRDRVVKMWREEGLACFQVNYGDF